MGLASALPVIAWMARFRHLVAPARRARAVALVMTVANLPLYGLTAAGMQLGWKAMLLTATAFLLLPVACTVAGPHQGRAGGARAMAGFPTVASPAPPAPPGSPSGSPWLLVPLILAIYLIGVDPFHVAVRCQAIPMSSKQPS